MNWFFRIFGRHTSHSLYVGARIRTDRGMGTVTGGSVNVCLDTPYRARNGSQNIGYTYNIKDMTERKIDAR